MHPLRAHVQWRPAGPRWSSWPGEIVSAYRRGPAKVGSACSAYTKNSRDHRRVDSDGGHRRAILRWRPARSVRRQFDLEVRHTSFGAAAGHAQATRGHAHTRGQPIPRFASTRIEVTADELPRREEHDLTWRADVSGTSEARAPNRRSVGRSTRLSVRTPERARGRASRAHDRSHDHNAGS